ncbi:MAG TPA: YHYH protein, partial [Polyangiaceae bacterium]
MPKLPLRSLAPIVPLLCIAACGSATSTPLGGNGAAADAGATTGMPDGATTGSSDGGGSASDAGVSDGATPNGDAGSASSCFTGWSQITQIYADAKNVGSCTGVSGAQAIVSSLMNLEGITIDNNGTTMTPCIDVRCDSSWVYVGSNALPHYDFVQTTPNALVANTYIFRLPITPSPVGASASAVSTSTIDGCSAAYSSYVGGTAGNESSDPSGFCGTGTMYDDLASGTRAYAQKIPCLSTTGLTIDGVPVFGPNEASVPDAWGNPVYYWPETANDPYVPSNLSGGAALDLCGGHTANAMHYHGAVQACFERDASGKPKNSYVTATENWNFGASLTDDCTEESPIVGWSVDGYPIRGSCVCLARNADGSCKTVKRARSSWVYRGLGAWGTSSTAADLGNEGKACTSVNDCCTGSGTCKYKCSHAVWDDASAAGGTVADRRCVLLDYAWCTHHFEDRSKQDVSAANFVYLDRCNGYEGPDGYSYYAITSFPYLTGCYHGAPSATSAGGAVGGGMGGGGGGGGMAGGDGGALPMCQAGQT